MPNKTQEYLNLAQQTAKELTRYWENWTDYLTTASRLYKYNFADQLMIYAQRPDATACASFDLWNDRMNRYVRRGSKGIALLDQSSSVPRLHYVFDVSDTGVRRNSRDPEVWQLGPDLVQPVSEMLAREYGIRHERITQQIADICGKLVDSYWDNNSGDICNELFTWADVYDTANHDERRAILQQFIKEIRVRKDYEISITLNASFNQVEQLKAVSTYDGAEIFEEISEKGA